MIHPSKVLKEIGLQALKSFGQNFLTTQSALEGLEKYLDSSKVVLEIGPGLGAVSEFLIQKNFSVLAIEKDKKLAEYLSGHFKKSFQVYQDDFLKLEAGFLETNNITQIMGNLPFYITTDIITRVIKQLTFVNTFILGIQKEVGQRLLKGMGNSLALFVKSQGDFIDQRVVGKNNFYPVPDVDAIWLVWKRNQKIQAIQSFELFLRGLFWGKRKNIYNTLTKNPFFKNSPETQNWRKKISMFEDSWKNIRAEDLTFEQIKSIFTEISGEV